MQHMRMTAMRSAVAMTVSAAVAVSFGFSCAVAGTPKVPATTPNGVTLVEVVREGGTSQPVLLWVRLGDADGRTVLASDEDSPGVSKCVAACAQEFTPLLAARGAKTFDDWSLVRREDGSLQWAYRTHPLYSWVKEKQPGDVAQTVAAAARPAGGARGGGGARLMPPHGWQVVRFEPTASVSLPDGIDAKLVGSAQADALVDVNGLTLYAFNGDARRDGQVCAASGCTIQWIPLTAPAIASGVGDFSIVTRIDGARQWAYNKQPLYVYKGDKLPGDVHGAGVDKRWNVAELTENFRPAHVEIRSLNGYGDVMAVNGMTLYGGYPFEKRWGGRNLRDTFLHNAYSKGKQLAGSACVDAECLKSWRPMLAPADAQSNGFWEPITRPDGSKQWAYKGYAMYTFAGDRAPGDHTGQAVYAFEKVEGSESDIKQALLVVNISKAPGGAGIYWNIAKP
jgi:predicted lipoprotein with Yx(FWY)xxD motif